MFKSWFTDSTRINDKDARPHCEGQYGSMGFTYRDDQTPRASEERPAPPSPAKKETPSQPVVVHAGPDIKPAGISARQIKRA